MPRPLGHRRKRLANCIEQLEPRTLLATTVFSDGFEGAFPGSWVLGRDGFNTSLGWNTSNARVGSGSWSAFASDNGTHGNITYDNNLINTMTRQGISLVGYATATLTFKYWINTEATYDTLKVKVRNQSGTTSTVFTDSGNDSALGWQTASINLTSYAGQSNLAVIFEFATDEAFVANLPAGAWIDDVKLVADTSGDPPPAVSSGLWIWANPFGDDSINANIASASEYDVYAFQPDISGSYVISTIGSLDSQLRVYNSTGNAITPIIDDTFSGESVTLNLNGSSWYFIAVGGYQAATGNYTLNINGPNYSAPNVPLDANNSAAVQGTIAPSGDIDYLSLTAPAGSAALSLTLTPTGFDSFLELYDSSGVRLIGNDSGEYEEVDSILSYPITPGATYYAAVLGSFPQSAGNWRLDISFNATVNFGDPPDTITPDYSDLIYPQASGDLDSFDTIDSTEEYDIWAFMPQVTGSFHIETGGDINSQLRIYNSAGDAITPLINDTNDGESITLNLTEGSWYYFAIGAYQTETGFYTLVIDGPTPPPQHLDTPAPDHSATVNAAIDYGGDADFYELVAPPGTEYLNVTISPSPTTDTEFVIEGPDGGQGYNNRGNGVPDVATRFPVTAGQTYHITVYGRDETVAGSYQISVDFGPDQPVGTLRGTVFNDRYADGTKASNEPGLDGWTVFLDTNDDGLLDPGEASSTTDAQGNYTFFEIPVGSYTVAYQLKAGWMQTAPDPSPRYHVNLSSDQLIDNLNFGSFPTVFTGTPGRDSLSVDMDYSNPGWVKMQEWFPDQQVFYDYSIPRARFQGVSWNGLGGDDEFIVSDMDGQPFATAPLVIDGGDGLDRLHFYGVNRSFNVDLASLHFEELELESVCQIDFLASQHLSALLIENSSNAILSAPVLHLGSLTISTLSELDMKTNAMIIDHGDLAVITDKIHQGLFSSDTGIRSSSNLSNRRLGAIANTNPIRTSFAGENGLTGNEILVMHTIIGDLNLDKNVSIADFVQLASHFNQGGTWGDGDVNYDGTTTIADFIALASNFNQSFAGEATPESTPESAILNSTPSIKRTRRPSDHEHRRHRHYPRPPQLMLPARY